jgi:hypothetical protein
VDFNLNQADYVPLASVSGAGVRVAISHPTQSFSLRPKSDGFMVKPHTMTDFAIKIHQTLRQPEPYKSKCLDTWDEYPVFPDDTVHNVGVFVTENVLDEVDSNGSIGYTYQVRILCGK